MVHIRHIYIYNTYVLYILLKSKLSLIGRRERGKNAVLSREGKR